jgi:hypothetical protein
VIFDTREWRHVSQHYPLLNGEIVNLRQQIVESAMVAHALVMWGEALQASIQTYNRWDENTFTSPHHSDGTTSTGGRWYPKATP